MKMIEIQEFRKFLIEVSDEIRSKPTAPYFDGALKKAAHVLGQRFVLVFGKLLNS